MNPYAAPQSQILQATHENEAVRKEHINTEASIKTVGILYYLGTFALLVFAMIAFTGRDIQIGGPLFGVIFLLLALGQGVTAYGLRRLQGWARIPTIIFSCIGLLSFPMGTIINGYILSIILGKQGKFVMTPEYQQIIATTPHVKRKSSIVAMVLLGLLLLILICVIVFATIRR